MSNKNVTAYQIAIPLDFKVAINSLIADMSWDRGGLSSTKIIFVGLRSGAGPTSGANFQNGGQIDPISGANFDSPTTGADFESYTRERQNFTG